MSLVPRHSWFPGVSLGAVIAIGSLLIILALDPHINGRARDERAQQVSTSQVGGPFALTEHTGRPVTEASFIGKAKIVFFGFTSCPDICPTTLGFLSTLLAELGQDSARLDALFITVDPERDTPQKLKQYLELFDRRIVGLTGAPQQVSAAAKAFAIHYEKVPQADSYSVNHTVAALLFSSDWKFIRPLDLRTEYSDALVAVRAALQQESPEKRD